MIPDLKAYLFPEDAEQPDWLANSLRQLVGHLAGAAEDDAWLSEIRKYRADVEEWIATGALTGNVAAGVFFIAAVFEAAHLAEGRKASALILGYVMQVTLSDAQWQGYLKAAAADGVTFSENDGGPVRLASFPDAVLLHLVKHHRLDVLRSIIRFVHHGIDDIARRAMRDARDFETWVGHLAILAAHLTLRRWLPLTFDDSEEDSGRIELTVDEDSDPLGGKFVTPSRRDNPILQSLFDAEEIQTLHRKEAYAAECFAHLFASVLGNFVTEEGQNKVAEEYRHRLAEDRIAARQWLALGKSHFEIAPYH